MADPPRRPGRAPLGERAESLRRAMWLMILLTGGLGSITFGALRKLIPPELALPALLLTFAAALGALWCGARGHRRAIEDREGESGRAMVIALATQLGRQDDETLGRLARQGGPAAEAAELILKGRRAPHPSDRLRASSARPSIEK